MSKQNSLVLISEHETCYGYDPMSQFSAKSNTRRYRATAIFFIGLGVGVLLGFDFFHTSSASIAKPQLIEATSTPEAKPLSVNISVDASILVYHIVRPAYTSDSASVRTFAVTPEVFDAQMAYLQSSGYHIVPFSALENYFYAGSSLPSHPVILNFDDGWEDQYVYALPILEKYHYTATFFPPTNWINYDKSFLTWAQLREMITLGMSVGSHSRSHIPLADVTNQTILASEIQDSKQILEKELGTTINEFDYPYGSFSSTTIAAVKAAGYKAARTEIFGRYQSISDIFALRAINAPTTTVQFEKMFSKIKSAN